MQVARTLVPTPSLSRMQSFGGGHDDGAMLDAIMEDVAIEPVPGYGEAGSTRLIESLRGCAPVDIEAECL